MARKRFYIRNGNHVGEFPPEDGWQKDRRGVRRTLCSVASLLHLSEDEQQLKLWDLYRENLVDLKKIREKEKEKKARQRRDRKNWMVSKAARTWLAAAESDNVSMTVSDYRRSLDLYLDAVGDHPLKEFDQLKYADYLKYLKQQRGKLPGSKMSATTVNKHARQFQVFLNWAYEMEIIDRLPKLKKPQKPKKDMDTYDIDDLFLIRQRIEERQATARRNEDHHEVMQMTNALRVWWMATYSIMRLGPLWAMKLSWIDMKKKIIRIQDNPDLDWKNKKQKWPNKPIAAKLTKFLKKDLAKRSKKEVYFLDKGNGEPWYLQRGDISRLFSELCEECDLPKLKPLHHGFRATMITHLLLEGIDPQSVQQLADHEDLATTMSYRDSRKTSQKNAVSELNDLL